MPNPFKSGGGKWFKGSLHCHTTNSDGAFSPTEVLRMYRENGYDFVAITDHGKITKVAQKSEAMLPIPGNELSVGTSRAGENYHIVGVGLEGNTMRPNGDDGPDAVEGTIDAIVDQGGLAFIAHPYWSGLITEDIARLKGHHGIEIFNTGCEAEVGKGFSTTHWDQLLSLGEMTNGIAVDDAHRYVYPPYDAMGGLVWAKANELSCEGIMKALREGSFYSSMGPKIVLVEIDRTLKVKCSCARKVSMISHNGSGMVIDYPTVKSIIESWRSKTGEKTDGAISAVDVEDIDGGVETKITLRNGRKIRGISTNDGMIEAECDLEFFNRYVRIEVVDRENRKAWTNPVLIK